MADGAEDPALQSIHRYNSEGNLNDITKVWSEALYDHVKLWGETN